jgi:hypothetical protein
VDSTILSIFFHPVWCITMNRGCCKLVPVSFSGQSVYSYTISHAIVFETKIMGDENLFAANIVWYLFQAGIKRRLKNATGGSPLNDLQKVRIQIAKAQLENGLESIEEIDNTPGRI